MGKVSELVLAGPVSLSTPALHALVREEIPIAWMSSGFWFVAITGARGPRSAHVREGQYAPSCATSAPSCAATGGATRPSATTPRRR